jgi:hypothetical protein
MKSSRSHTVPKWRGSGGRVQPAMEQMGAGWGDLPVPLPASPHLTSQVSFTFQSAASGKCKAEEVKSSFQGHALYLTPPKTEEEAQEAKRYNILKKKKKKEKEKKKEIPNMINK